MNNSIQTVFTSATIGTELFYIRIQYKILNQIGSLGFNDKSINIVSIDTSGSIDSQQWSLYRSTPPSFKKDLEKVISIRLLNDFTLNN